MIIDKPASRKQSRRIAVASAFLQPVHSSGRIGILSKEAKLRDTLLNWPIWILDEACVAGVVARRFVKGFLQV